MKWKADREMDAVERQDCKQGTVLVAKDSMCESSA